MAPMMLSVISGHRCLRCRRHLGHHWARPEL